LPQIPIQSNPFLASNYKAQVASFTQKGELVTLGEITQQKKE
jgi:hypothetical protein